MRYQLLRVRMRGIPVNLETRERSRYKNNILDKCSEEGVETSPPKAAVSMWRYGTTPMAGFFGIEQPTRSTACCKEANGKTYPPVKGANDFSLEIPIGLKSPTKITQS